MPVDASCILSLELNEQLKVQVQKMHKVKEFSRALQPHQVNVLFMLICPQAGFELGSLEPQAGVLQI